MTHDISPYTRATYRYTPLLALLLTPNEWLHSSFGKYLFAACDLLVGLLMHRLLVERILPATTSLPLQKKSSEIQEKDKTALPEDLKLLQEKISAKATLLVASHLLNPLVFTISTRGSSESVLSFFVLATLYFAYGGQWDIAAVFLGLSTHWKIYPFVYGVACLGVIANEGRKGVNGNGRWWSGLISCRGARFAVISAGTFALLGVAMYAM